MSTTVPGEARVPAAGFCPTTVPGFASLVRRRVTVPSSRPSISSRVRASACDRPSRSATAIVGAPRLTTTVTGAPGLSTAVAAGRVSIAIPRGLHRLHLRHREPRRRDQAPRQLAVQARHIRYRNLGRALARHQGDPQPRRSTHAGRRVLPHDRALGRGGVRLAASVLHLETGFPELVRRFLQRQPQDARYHAVSGKDGRGEQEQVRRQVAGEQGTEQRETPAARAQRVECREPPFPDWRDMPAEPHQRTRTSRAAYAPSVPWRCGSDWKSPAAVTSAGDTAPAAGTRANSG